MALSPDPVEAHASGGAFELRLDNFAGPFEVLLGLIAAHELDITELALSRVTDEFIAYVRAREIDEHLDEVSEFIVVAATLLDMKIVALLPQGDYADPEDVAILEARDLLFARLLQYKAFKDATAWFASQLAQEERRIPRQVALESRFRNRAPELRWTTSVDDFAALALMAFAPKALPTVGLDHLHAPLVSIREQAEIVVSRLRVAGTLSFRELVADAGEKGIIIARFLAVLELYRQAAVNFEQHDPLGDLLVAWDAADWKADNLVSLGADFD